LGAQKLADEIEIFAFFDITSNTDALKYPNLSIFAQ
jgi:hypothetical protein